MGCERRGNRRSHDHRTLHAGNCKRKSQKSMKDKNTKNFLFQRNCQRLSMGPNFICFLGQKYGYRPIPTYILSSELQLIRDDLASNGVDVSLLDQWYKKDSNSVPPISILQPISSILVNFINKV